MGKLTLAVTVCLAAGLAAGCATQTESTAPLYDSRYGAKQPEQVTPDLYLDGAQPSPEPVIRDGRYRIVSTRPSAEQKDLLAQIVIFEASSPNLTVKNALDQVTARSGYRLCPALTHERIKTLYNLPLPEAHEKIGPMTLRNSLQILAGPAYSVEVNELSRWICFKTRDDYNSPVRLSPASETLPAITAGQS